MKLSPYQAAYFGEKRQLLARIKEFADRRHINVWSELARDTVQLHNTHSWLAEMRTGMFWDKLVEDLKYNTAVKWPGGKKTPDWTFRINGQYIVTDTLRINSQGENLNTVLQDDFESSQNDPNYGGYIRGGTIIIDTAHYSGQGSKVTRKEQWYRSMIEHLKVPFIICIDPEPGTLLAALDTHDFLCHYKFGLFNADENFSRNVAGVLFNHGYGDEFTLFPNECAAFPLSAENLELMYPYRYRYRKIR